MDPLPVLPPVNEPLKSLPALPSINDSSAPTKTPRVLSMLEEKQRFDDDFANAETKYMETNSLISEDASFSKFLGEYNKMHRALQRSRDHITKLVIQFEDYDTEFNAHVNKTDEASKSLENDTEVIGSLKSQIQAAEKRVDLSTKIEDDSKNELRQVKVDIVNLNNTIKQGVGLSLTQEKSLNELMQTKEMYSKELESELDKIVNLRNGISEMTDKMRIAELTKRDLDRDIFSLKEKNATKKAEIDSEVRTKDRLERDLRELRVVVTVKSQEVRSKQDSVNRATDDISILESQIKTQKQLLEKLKKDQGGVSNSK